MIKRSFNKEKYILLIPIIGVMWFGFLIFKINYSDMYRDALKIAISRNVAQGHITLVQGQQMLDEYDRKKAMLDQQKAEADKIRGQLQ